jgi:hypothetical protein
LIVILPTFPQFRFWAKYPAQPSNRRGNQVGDVQMTVPSKPSVRRGGQPITGPIADRVNHLGSADHTDAGQILDVLDSLKIQAMAKEKDRFGVEEILEPIAGQLIFKSPKAPGPHRTILRLASRFRVDR